jgi:ubiquinone/menaquinone biosynthesis C-methylase UbiE
MQIDANKFDNIARNVFAPVYPLLASQMLERSGVTDGVCLDLGSGGGYLGLAVAKSSNLTVYLLDESLEMRAIAERNIREIGMENRVMAFCGDVHTLLLENNSVDLVVSRGSIYFWDDLPQVLKEISRVLAPGGKAQIGGGFGSRELRDGIIAKMREKEEGDWQPKCRSFDDAVYQGALTAAGISDAEIIRDESGVWITFEGR